MSFLLSRNAAKCTLGSPSAKAVLRCLCDYADDDGTNCRPSTETISLETELDRRTVFKAVSFLSSNEWLKVFNAGRGSRNFYALNVQKINNGFEQAKVTKEVFKSESGIKFDTSNENATSYKKDTKSSGKNDTRYKNDTSNNNVTRSSNKNVTSNENATSDKNVSGVVTFLQDSGSKNDTQLYQDYISTKSNIDARSESVDDELPLVEASEVVETEPVFSKPKTEKKSRSTGTATKKQTSVVKPDDVSADLWADFLAHRKQKKAIVSERVINTIRNEAKIAGWTLEEALDEVILRDWRGFKAEWVKDEWKDPNAKWITADDFYKDLEPVTYSDEAKAVLGEYVKKGMRAYNVSDIPDVPKETNK